MLILDSLENMKKYKKTFKFPIIPELRKKPPCVFLYTQKQIFI